MGFCHSPTQPHHELELDLIMGRNPPPPPHPKMKRKKDDLKKIMEDEPINQNQPNWL
jgi:hypothetical protein